MRASTAQHGSTLVVALLMLVILTLLTVSAINTGSIDLRVVGNLQEQEQARAIADLSMEQALSDIDTFNTPTTTTGSTDALTVTTSAPTCLRAEPASGYSAVWGLAPQDTEWELSTTVTDPGSGARAVVSQGVRIRLPAGNCI